MIAIILEVEPTPGQRDIYLNLAARLKSLPEQMDGLISVERFQSITNPDEMLSLSSFHNEEAVKAWRNLEQHRGTQYVSRNHVFADYRLCITHAIRDYGMTNRGKTSTDSRMEYV